MANMDRYEYRQEAILAARDAIAKTDRALIVLASALGKTRTSAYVWHDFRKGPGVFLVHSNEILDHAIREYRVVYGDEAKLVLFTGNMEEIEGADVVFATLQMVYNHRKKFPHSRFTWMTVDESHHAQARTWRTVIHHFKCPRLGITATPDRLDMLDIREMFGNEVVNIRLEEAIARGWLPHVEYHVLTDYGLDEMALRNIMQEVTQEGRRLSLAQINRRIFIRARDEKVAEIINGYDLPTVIFCRSVAHANHFRKFLTSAEVYHSGQDAGKNSEVLARLRMGITKRVLAVDAFNEGIDVPDLGLVVFYRTTGSDRIFRQQLGRGLRPVKDTLVVLDFVANVERIATLKKMSDEIAAIHTQYTSQKKRVAEGFANDPLHVRGAMFDFTFSDFVVDIVELLRRVNVEFYPTWQEASEAAKKLEICDQRQYRERYRHDLRLPSNPFQSYQDFPGWYIFLGKEAPYRYQTWQEASEAAREIGITTVTQYQKNYKKDPLLPATPNKIYPGFPGWPAFFGRKKAPTRYTTWQEASEATQKLGITGSVQYSKEYKKDPRLRSTPEHVYRNFPGWHTFLGKK